MMTQFCHFEQSYVGTAVNNAAPASAPWDAGLICGTWSITVGLQDRGTLWGDGGMFELAYSLFSPRLTTQCQTRALNKPTRDAGPLRRRRRAVTYCSGSSPKSSTVSGSECVNPLSILREKHQECISRTGHFSRKSYWRKESFVAESFVWWSSWFS